MTDLNVTSASSYENSRSSLNYNSDVGEDQQSNLQTETVAPPQEKKADSKALNGIPINRVPVGKPAFGLGDLKRAIPEHCFERSYVTSFRYLFVDVALIAFMFWLAPYLDHPALSWPVRWGLWITYWLMQGFVMTGLWVIAHECGHQSFSPSAVVNDIVGLAGHTLLLVPYFSWKFSHAKHHSKTGNVDLDEVHVPRISEEEEPEPSLLASLVRLLQYSVVGWYAYLFVHTRGHKYETTTNHFSPYSPIFAPSERKWVVVTDVALVLFLGVLGYLVHVYSFLWVTKVYLVPLFHTNFWLVHITFLQHAHVNLPHYTNDKWNWLQGALCTVDRDYGFLNVLFHHIADTHVAHHLFSKIPHYHAQEATEAIKPLLGDYYCYDGTNVLVALWRNVRRCVCVYPSHHDSGLWYTTDGRAKSPLP